MPILACPKCSSRLRVPEGAKANIRCPKCQAVISTSVSPPPTPAFEVVEETPPETPQPSKAAAKHGDKPPPPEVLDLPEEIPPGKARRRNDTFAPPRQPRSGLPDDEWYEQRRTSHPLSPAKVGLLLTSLSLWLYLAAYGILTLMIMMEWGGVRIPRDLLILPGIAGLLNWLLALVATGFLIAAPAKLGVRGLAIAAAVLAVVHLILILVTAFQSHAGSGLSPFEGRSRIEYYNGRELRNPFDWKGMVGHWHVLDGLIYAIAYNSNVFSSYVMPLISGISEIGQLILMLLVAKGMCRSVKAHRTADQLHMSLLLVTCGTAALAALHILVMLILREGGFKDFGTIMNVIVGLTVLILLTHTCLLIQPAIAMNSGRAAFARRIRDLQNDR